MTEPREPLALYSTEAMKLAQQIRRTRDALAECKSAAFPMQAAKLCLDAMAGAGLIPADMVEG